MVIVDLLDSKYEKTTIDNSLAAQTIPLNFLVRFFRFPIRCVKQTQLVGFLSFHYICHTHICHTYGYKL